MNSETIDTRTALEKVGYELTMFPHGHTVSQLVMNTKEKHTEVLKALNKLGAKNLNGLWYK